MFILAYAVLFVLSAALQRAWPQPLRVSNVGPELVLVLVACAGITRGPVAGYAAGFVGGFLVAAASDGPFGGLLFSHMVVGFLAGQLRGRVFADHLLAAPVIALLATLVASFLLLVVSPPAAFLPWLADVGRALFYNCLLSPVPWVCARAAHRRWPARAEA